MDLVFRERHMLRADKLQMYDSLYEYSGRKQSSCLYSLEIFIPALCLLYEAG